MAVIVLSGILGGPLAPILSGIIIGVFRIFSFDVSQFSIIAGINTIIIGLVIGVFSCKKTDDFSKFSFLFYIFHFTNNLFYRYT